MILIRIEQSREKCIVLCLMESLNTIKRKMCTTVVRAHYIRGNVRTINTIIWFFNYNYTILKPHNPIYPYAGVLGFWGFGALGSLLLSGV